MQEFLESLPLLVIQRGALALVYAGSSFLALKLILRYLKRLPPIAKAVRLANITIFLVMVYIFLWRIGALKQDIVFGVLLALILLFGGYLIIVTVEYFLFDYFSRRDPRRTRPGLLRDVLRMIVLLMVTYGVFLGVFQFNLSTILVSSAVLTAVLGLALQDILSSVLAGVALHLEKPFNVGDWVQISGQQGEVVSVSWRAIRIKTLGNDYVVIPNNTVSKVEIINYTQPDPRQGQWLNVSASYNDPPNKVRQAILEVAAQVPGILKEPPPVCRTKEYMDFSIHYECRYFITDFYNHPEILQDFASRIWYKFKRENIEIPFPIRTLRPMDWVEQRKASDSDKISQKVRGYLRSVALFEDLSDSEIVGLASESPLYNYGVGEDVIKQGDEGTSMFIIVEGQVKVLLYENGIENELATLGPGETFGEMSLFTGQKRNAAVRCAEDSQLVEITKMNFKNILLQDPGLVEKLSDKIGARASELQERLSATNKILHAKLDGQSEKEGFLRVIKNFFEL